MAVILYTLVTEGKVLRRMKDNKYQTAIRKGEIGDYYMKKLFAFFSHLYLKLNINPRTDVSLRPKPSVSSKAGIRV